MRVTGNSGAWPSPYSTSKGRRTESGPGWEQYLDPEVQKRKMAALPEKGSLGSVFMQFEDDYKAWKAQQPELALPDSQGWTEENLAFLKEHYSGDLSAYEVYDVLETMRRMGVISQKEENYASGAVMIVLDPSEINGVMYYTDQEDPSFWLGNFHKTPMVSFHSLDDILSWVEEFRTEEHPDVITHAEAMARGWVPYRAKV
ncbi:hypothetical protein AALA80_18680 [Oscillospiraceae bacterium 50-60]|nr:hypothetical protein [Oscillibacter sp.]